MEAFTEEHSKRLLSKEWLVKVDAAKSIPYLLKFHSSSVDLACVILVTDTKCVWTEVLNSQQFARRWRSCNKSSPCPFADAQEEESWRESSLELLSNAHTLGGISDFSFDIVDSNFSDFAVELECEHFKWRWETNFLGHRSSAEIISKHLIFPLISVNHLALSSPDALGEVPDSDVEKAVDKLGRTARRALDNHIKNALMKPRVATTLRRISAMFNFATDLPPISSTAEKPVLEPKAADPPKVIEDKTPPKGAARDTSQSVSGSPSRVPSPPRSGSKAKSPVPLGSETEDEDDDEPAQSSALAASKPPQVIKEKVADVPMRSPSPELSKPVGSDSDSSPQPKAKAKAAKKPRLASPSDEERDSKPESSTTAPVKRVLTRQPVKRGGKRF